MVGVEQVCGIYTSAVEAAQKVNGKIIGFDIDQSAIISTNFGAKDMVVTSAMKGYAATVETVLSDIVAGNGWLYAGTMPNLGVVSYTNPKMNFVQLPWENTQWNASFTQSDYCELVRRISRGEIAVSDEIRYMPATAITVNAYGNIK